MSVAQQLQCLDHLPEGCVMLQFHSFNNRADIFLMSDIQANRANVSCIMRPFVHSMLARVFVYVDWGGSESGMSCPVGQYLKVNEVNSKRQLPIGSKASQGSGGGVTANMSQTQENSRERAEACSSIHSYSLWGDEPNLYPSASSDASHQNKRDSLRVEQKKKWNNWLQTLCSLIFFEQSVQCIKGRKGSHNKLIFPVHPRWKQGISFSVPPGHRENKIVLPQYLERGFNERPSENSSWVSIKLIGL